MQIKTFITHHLVKGNDLNHHGTLYAGRGAEWFVESGFIAASNMTSPESTVCLKIHGMVFTRPAKKGSILRYESKVVHAGRTSLVVYVKVLISENEEFVVDGFMTFIHVDSQGKPTPHGLIIEATSPEHISLQQKVQEFLN